MRGRSYALVACAVCVVCMLGSTMGAVSVAGAITKEACNQPVVVARLAFGPGTVARGQSSTARLSGRNCTRHPHTVDITWTAKFSGATTTGCPIIDPLRQQVTVPPATHLSAALRYLVPAGCRATALTASARVTNSAGALIRTKTATLRIIQPHSG